MTLRVKALALFHGAVLAGAVGLAVVNSDAGDWTPVWLPVALLAMAIASDLLAIDLRSMRVSASFSTLVLAMVLLGPAPAVAISVVTVALDSARHRLDVGRLLSNLATFALFPLAGALLAERLGDRTDPFAEGGLVLAVFFATVTLNFLMVWLHQSIVNGASWIDGFRTVFFPVLPAQLATGVMTALVAVLAARSGPWSLVVLAVLILIFQYLLRYAKQARDQADELGRRNRELASLHVGLISTTLKTLALRDHMTARHSAAVARYARAVAEDLGLDERDQDVIHTAALFHDVGKFIFPDHVLLAHGELSESDHAMIRRHPVVGADLVAEIEGYGPVAEVVRAHHERIDGQGYPDGLVGDAIPLGSRIIAVADVYDVITARDTYRTPVSSDEAFEELRRVAGTQLDAQVVSVFIRLIQRRGMRFRHSTAQDFELELGLQHRVDAHAAPLKVS